MAETTTTKIGKDQAGYRADGGSPQTRCGTCSMFMTPRGCSLVKGDISPKAVCVYYKPKREE